MDLSGLTEMLSEETQRVGSHHGTPFVSESRVGYKGREETGRDRSKTRRSWNTRTHTSDIGCTSSR